MRKISLWVVYCLLSFLGFLFLNFAFPELDGWKRFFVFMSFMCFYYFLKLANYLTGSDDNDDKLY